MKIIEISLGWFLSSREYSMKIGDIFISAYLYVIANI